MYRCRCPRGEGRTGSYFSNDPQREWKREELKTGEEESTADSFHSRSAGHQHRPGPHLNADFHIRMRFKKTRLLGGNFAADRDRLRPLAQERRENRVDNLISSAPETSGRSQTLELSCRGTRCIAHRGGGGCHFASFYPCSRLIWPSLPCDTVFRYIQLLIDVGFRTVGSVGTLEISRGNTSQDRSHRLDASRQQPIHGLFREGNAADVAQRRNQSPVGNLTLCKGMELSNASRQVVALNYCFVVSYGRRRNDHSWH
jgi:hypothetical protein